MIQTIAQNNAARLALRSTPWLYASAALRNDREVVLVAMNKIDMP